MGIEEADQEQQTIPPKRQSTNRASCPKRPYGYIVNPDKGKHIPTGCMAWACKPCARVLSYRVGKRLEPYDWTAKLELTLEGDGEPTRENNLRLARGTRSLLQFIRRYFRRKYGRSWRLRYARMHGIGDQGGRLHSHMVWDAPFIPQAVLSEHAEACGLGFRVYIKSLDHYHGGRKQASDYVAKQAVRYVADQPLGDTPAKDLPPRARRFQSAGVAAYEPEPGWYFHRHCPFGLPCEFCGLCPEPEVFRLEHDRWLRFWNLNTATGELIPRELTARALRSLVDTGETASPIPAKPAEHSALPFGGHYATG